MSTDNKGQPKPSEGERTVEVDAASTAEPDAAPKDAATPSAMPERDPAQETATGTAGTEPTRRSGRPLVLAAVVAVPLLIAVGAVGTWFYLQDRFMAQQTANTQLQKSLSSISDRIEVAEAKIKPLPGRIEQLSTDISDLKSLSMPTAQLAAKAADIEQRLSRLDDQLQTMSATHLKAEDLLERVERLETNAVRAASLDQRLSAMEESGAEAREALMKGSSIVLAVGHLAQVAQDSRPFTAELTTLKMLARDDEQLKAAADKLEPYAATGVPTFAKIRADFPAMAVAVTRAQSAAGDGEWYDRALNRVASLVTVRRTGPEAQAAGGTSGLLATAEQALSADDLAAAVDAVAKIDGPAAPATQNWLKEARARLAANQALAVLEDRAITYLSKVKG